MGYFLFNFFFLLSERLLSNLKIWGRYAKFLKKLDIFVILIAVMAGNSFIFLFNSNEAPYFSLALFFSVLLSALMIVLDIKTKFLFRIVSLYIFVLNGVLALSLGYSPVYISILFLLIIFFYFYSSLLKGLGGGDIPFFISFLPLIEPFYISYYLLLASVLSFIYMKISCKNKVPLGPFIFLGFIGVNLFLNPPI